jgi:hypothetical protein
MTTDVELNSEAELLVAMKRVFDLMVDNPAANTPDGEELARLIAAIDKFEGGRYPVGCCASAAKDCAERMLEVLRHLVGLYELAGAIQWCDSRQPLLDGQRPIDMLITDQGAAQVRAAVAQLHDGVHV